MGKFPRPRAASLFNVEVTGSGTGKQARLSLQITRNEERYQMGVEDHGQLYPAYHLSSQLGKNG